MASVDILPIGVSGGGPYFSTCSCHSSEGDPNLEKFAMLVYLFAIREKQSTLRSGVIDVVRGPAGR
jgi:hypothetical protein